MLISGPLSDRFGRKRLLTVASLLYTFSALASAFAPSYQFLVFARMIGGFGVGMSLILAPMYIAEISPAGIRAPPRFCCDGSFFVKRPRSCVGGFSDGVGVFPSHLPEEKRSFRISNQASFEGRRLRVILEEKPVPLHRGISDAVIPSHFRSMQKCPALGEGGSARFARRWSIQGLIKGPPDHGYQPESGPSQ